ncbi:hypothetical protein [Lentzea aerocolonigenes]|uniref:hypothetical protein n=1 Tax=Lentzea aerocolonigenes TaxID=68170 RepID=UPI00068DC413|nr:hypothetical protein [Lentzea aerocolonigenes]MCP2248735.1 hypothetical protein [Lentzea aerocolonigenes]
MVQISKQTGIALTTLSVDDAGGTPRDIRSAVTNWDLAFPRGVQDVTGQDATAMDRLLLLADSSVNLAGAVDAASNGQHDVFKTVTTTSVARTVSIDAGTPSVGNEYLFTDYQWTRAQDGSLVWASPGVLTGGTINAWA